MIESTKMYLLYCDECRMPQEDSDGNGTSYFDKEDAQESLKIAAADGWKIVGKKCYCPECVGELEAKTSVQKKYPEATIRSNKDGSFTIDYSSVESPIYIAVGATKKEAWESAKELIEL